jgi:hypothetical protein
LLGVLVVASAVIIATSAVAAVRSSIAHVGYYERQVRDGPYRSISLGGRCKKE